MSDKILVGKILVQIGKSFYSLKHEFNIKDAHELKLLIESKKYDLRLLQDEIKHGG